MTSYEATRFDLDMDGSMEPAVHGEWVRHEDFVEAYAAGQRDMQERAGQALSRLIAGDGQVAADGVWIHDCVDAIRALEIEK